MNSPHCQLPFVVLTFNSLPVFSTLALNQSSCCLFSAVSRCQYCVAVTYASTLTISCIHQQAALRFVYNSRSCLISTPQEILFQVKSINPSNGDQLQGKLASKSHIHISFTTICVSTPLGGCIHYMLNTKQDKTQTCLGQK